MNELIAGREVMSINETCCKDDGASFITTASIKVDVFREPMKLDGLLSNKRTNRGSIHTFSPSCQAAHKIQEQFASAVHQFENDLDSRPPNGTQ